MNAADVRNIAVIGAGLIGQAAVVEFALGGYPVTLNSRSEVSLQRGLNGAREMLDRMLGLGLTTEDEAADAMNRVSTVLDLKACVEDVQLVYEAVYEDLELKQGIFREMDEFCPAETIFVSGTSSLSLKDLASATNRPDKMLLANYTNPPYLVPLAEVMRNDDTSDETVSVFCDVLTEIGKKPVVIEKEVPGFVGNRLQVALLREALHLVQTGVVTAEGVDTIIKSSIGRRWAVAGVFEVFELAGQDLTMAAYSYLAPHLDASVEPPQVLRDKVERGELGVKTGKGFYDWTPESEAALRRRIANALVEIEKWSRQE